MVKVSAEIIWLPSMSYSFIQQHIKELCGTELSIEGEPLHSSEEEESFIKIFGKLKLGNYKENKNSDFGIEQLINRWCGQDANETQNWLSLDKKIAFNNGSFDHTLDDRWINVGNMSFGTMMGLNKFAEHYSVMDQNCDKKLELKVANIKIQFQHDIEVMSVYFHVTRKKNVKEKNATTHRPYRFEFNYSAIDKILINKRKDSKYIDIYFYILHPPLLYIVDLPKDAKDKSYENYIKQSPDTTYCRADTFANCSHSDIGLSTILKVQFSPTKDSWNAICNFILTSKAMKAYFSPIFEFPKRKCYHSPKISEDQFSCIYALQSLLSRSRDVVVQINERNELSAVNDNLNKFAAENPAALEATLFDIFASFEQRKIVNFNKALVVFYEKNKLNINMKYSIPENMTAVRRAILTPTRLIFLPPHPYFKCRFFRSFESEYSVRLSVKDDNIENLSFTLFGRPKLDYDKEKNTDSDVENAANFSEEYNDCLNGETEESRRNSALERVKNKLLKGFKIDKRNYEVLGCSSSHFREHGMIFYASDSQGRNAEFARNYMGDFSKINKISKFMARLGQVFSQSLGYIEVPRSKIKVENDITSMSHSRDKPYEFSDGIGKIAPSIAQEVFEKLNIKQNPSAIQIRYAGCKGMLTQWPEMKDEIIVRESMKKFESDSEFLDVLKTSKPRLVYLNRPFITILSQLGVNDDVFLQLQNHILEALFNSLFSEEYATGILHACSMLRISYTRIHKVGIKILETPCFLLMLKAIFEHNVVKLSEKARIMILPSKGRTMFGVLDETKTLEYGQIFVQYTKDICNEDKDAETKILKNEIVVVTKNPCMHPGDVRKFEAVDVEGLHHIKDCIVFPAKGPRPHPNEMAGSDLDGDEYSVIWAKELLFECDNHDPMDFPEEETSTKNGSFKVDDMVNFFCDYVSAGQVGQIAIAHLVWADSAEGIFSNICKELAYKYSIALDFAKSGKTERLSREQRPEMYPDYLDKGVRNNSYLSKTILGQLYRSSKTVLLGFEGLVCTAKYDADEDLNYPGYENYKESARNALCTYSFEINSILQQYGIRSEGELLSGAILKTSKYVSAKQDLNDLTVIEHRVKKLFNEMQRIFCAEFLDGPSVEKIITLVPLIYGKHKERVFQKASAWYMITCEQSMNEKVCFGLPWTVHEILCGIKEEVQKQKKSPASLTQYEIKANNMILQKFPNIIHENEKNHITAFHIMNEWFKHPIIDSDDKKREYYDLISKLYDQITVDLEKQNCNEELSVFRIVLRYLHKLTCLLFNNATTLRRLQPDSRSLQEDIIGLLAFKTYLNILYCSEFDLSTLVDAYMEPSEQVFRLPLNDDIISDCIVHKEDEVKDLLKQWAKVDKIKCRLKHDRRNKCYALFKVKGNKYALHHFQNIIFQNYFRTALENIVK